MLTVTERPEVSPSAPTTTVPREYVHRVALSEVFLTGWHRIDPDVFTVTAQWPRSHSFYSTEHGVYDPLMLCETARQTFPLLAHAAYGIPFGYQLSWSRLSYTVNPSALRIEGTPAEIELRVTCSDIRYLRTLPTAVSMHIEVVRDGASLAVLDTRFGCHSPAVYRRLRAGDSDVAERFAHAPKPSAPVRPESVGRSRLQDVVLSPTPDRQGWDLRVDTAHPVLFDHPLDHVPGMFLLESVRQAAHALQPERGAMIPTAMDVTFSRYIEFATPCRIAAELLPAAHGDDTPQVRTEAVQDGNSAFTATVRMTDISALQTVSS